MTARKVEKHTKCRSKLNTTKANNYGIVKSRVTRLASCENDKRE